MTVPGWRQTDYGGSRGSSSSRRRKIEGKERIDGDMVCVLNGLLELIEKEGGGKGGKERLPDNASPAIYHSMALSLLPAMVLYYRNFINMEGTYLSTYVSSTNIGMWEVGGRIAMVQSPSIIQEAPLTTDDSEGVKIGWKAL